MTTLDRIRSLITPRRVLLALLVVALGAAGFSPASVRALLADLGWWGPLVLVLWLAAMLVVPLVPASVLHLGAGLAFGPYWGLALALLADFLGAGAGFLLARRWGRAAVAQRLSPGMRHNFNGLIGRMNWRSVLLLRLLPGPAYPLVSFAAGCSPLGFWRYSLASLLGVLPALALLVFAGDLVLRSPLLAFALVVVLVGGMALLGRLLLPKG
jgi:uncharacterized membrane protein YdjX (TVP38/TMEM64 family)